MSDPLQLRSDKSTAGPHVNKYLPQDVYNNLVKMMKYRDVVMTDQPLALAALSQKLNFYGFVTIKGSRAKTSLRHAAEVTIVLIAPGSPHATISAEFKKLLKLLQRQDSIKSELIFVSYDPLTIHIKKQIIKYRADNPKVYIEDYDYTIFLIELPAQVSVPRYTLVEQQEMLNWCEYHYTAPKFFPKLPMTDPMAVWLGLRPGMCVRVDRVSENAGEAVAYRLVI